MNEQIHLGWSGIKELSKETGLEPRKTETGDEMQKGFLSWEK